MTMTQPIDLIVVDLDGTLLNSQHQMTERSEQALKAAIEKGAQVVIATGKSRFSGEEVIHRLGLTTPGIYLQGLTIYRPDNSIAFQKTLEPSLARRVITFAEDRGFAMAAYSGNRILVRSLSPGADELASRYHEPLPEEVGPLQNLLDEIPVHKLLALKPGEPRRIKALRWQLQAQLDGQGRLVQALDDMLEILPPGASKGAALKVLLKELNIPAERVLAIGDGENDIEMIEVAGIGVAVDNAVPSLKAAADHVVASNDADGVAEAIERFVLGEAETDDQPEDAPGDEGAADNQPASSAPEGTSSDDGQDEDEA
jgi:Cof subfamily protein (haloacid dehalogenase superfamily)